ncbi:MAG TPA: hypothetical protein DCS93_08105 [Microscillaceae bacterium]|nr:hypothetical protein [Microscillaceae bacterium]
MSYICSHNGTHVGFYLGFIGVTYRGLACCIPLNGPLLGLYRLVFRLNGSLFSLYRLMLRLNRALFSLNGIGLVLVFEEIVVCALFA